MWETRRGEACLLGDAGARRVLGLPLACLLSVDSVGSALGIHRRLRAAVFAMDKLSPQAAGRGVDTGLPATPQRGRAIAWLF